MDTSSAHHDSLDPTNLDNFKNQLNLPNRDGLFGLLDASADPAELVARRERVEFTPGRETNMLVYRAERGERVWLNPTFLVKAGGGPGRNWSAFERSQGRDALKSSPKGSVVIV